LKAPAHVEPVDCLVFRCARQPELYLYLRADLAVEDLPAPLQQRTGRLTPVMRLSLTPATRLARVDAGRVCASLRDGGHYLQMPPDGLLQAHLYTGD
jgi:uncharacterized protein